MRVAAAVGAIATTMAFAAPGALARQTRIPVEDGHATARNLQVRPFQIVWTGDGTGVFAGRGTASTRPQFGRLHWSKWTATEGKGWGANWLNTCIPFCAEGKFTAFNVNLTVYRPRGLAGFKVFTRIRVVYTGKVPHGFKRTGVFTLRDQGKTFFWNFPI